MATVLELKRERIAVLDARIALAKELIESLTRTIDTDIEERVRLAAHVEQLKGGV